MQVQALRKIIIETLRNNKVRQLFPNITGEILDLIDNWLARYHGQSYQVVNDVAGKSDGLVVSDRKITLAEDWGVKLTNTQHPFIYKPSTIRAAAGKILAGNKGDVSNPVAAAVVDQNMNFIGSVGKYGTTLASGQYNDLTDFNFNAATSQYIISSGTQHVVHFYNATGAFVASIGDGTEGVAGSSSNKLATPVAVGYGENGIYVLNSTGVAGTGPEQGYLSLYSPERVFKKVALKPSLNGGTGRCFEGEIKNPKDMVVISNPDKIYILNGTDEIGIFDADFKLVKVINIPSEIYTPSLGLSRIAVDGNVIYVTAGSTGEIIALDAVTGDFLGKFGELRNESYTASDATIGCFNGLSGICQNLGKIYVTETLNNRVQVFGTGLVTVPKFYIEYAATVIPDGKKLVNVTMPLDCEINGTVTFKDQGGSGGEYTAGVAIERKLSSFLVKITFSPQLFSRKRPALNISPLHILQED